MNQNIEKILKDIKSIKIQGATNVAKASIGALFDFSKNFGRKNSANFIKKAEKLANQLAWARPDEPLNQNLLNFIIANLKADSKKDIKEKILNFQKSCQEALCLVLKNEELITTNGVVLIKKLQSKRSLAPKEKELSSLTRELNIFTHCNSSSVFKIIFGAHKAGIPIKVYNSETRPRYQGRIMAKHLAKSGIDVTMMTDSAAPFVISKNDPDRIDIDLVIIGADVVGMDGSALNKIGSYSLAMSAKNAGVPFYVAASLLKIRKDIASYKEIEIEKRDPTELWPAAASVFAKASADKKAMAGKQKSLKGLEVMNYAFDIVPPEYITGFITEFGILESKDVKKAAIKNYKEFFK